MSLNYNVILVRSLALPVLICLCDCLKCCSYVPKGVNSQHFVSDNYKNPWCTLCISAQCIIYGFNFSMHTLAGVQAMHQDKHITHGCKTYKFARGHIQVLAGNMCFCNQVDYCNYDFLTAVDDNLSSSLQDRGHVCTKDRGHRATTPRSPDLCSRRSIEQRATNKTTPVTQGKSYFLAVLIILALSFFGVTVTCVLYMQQ